MAVRGSQRLPATGADADTVLAWEERLDLVVHALAQLPDDVRLEIDHNHPERRICESLASAYGISDRVSTAAGALRPRGAVYRSQPPVSAVRPPSSSRGFRSMAQLVESLSRPDDVPAACREVDGVFAGQRIGVVTNLPTHYRVPLFNAMHRRLEVAGAQFHVFFLSHIPASRRWMRPQEAAFSHSFVPGIDVKRDRGRRVVPLGLARRLAQFSPTVLLVAGFSPAVAVPAAVYAGRRGVPLGIWSGDIPSRPTARSAIRRLQREWLVKRASFAAAYGSESARYLRSLRADLPLVIGRNTAATPLEHRKDESSRSVEFLAVARADRRKGLGTVIDAVRGAQGLRGRLTVIGEGPELQSLVNQAGGDPRIRFLGALPSEEVADAFGRSDAFLFPSRYDVFGIALVEAMGAGLAPIVSPLPGAVADLCVPGVNSLVVEGNDPDDWASALGRVVEDDDLRLSLGAAAARTIRSRWTIEHAADAMLAGFRLGIRTFGARGEAAA